MGAFVFFYHRIFVTDPAPDVTLRLFEWEMQHLKNRYHILSLDDLLAYIHGDFTLRKPGVAITFDDGWFDNYVYAYPVLKKYGLKATIFVSAARMANEKYIRPSLEDYWKGRSTPDRLQRPRPVREGWQGSPEGALGEFLTWDELELMNESGVISVQSHGMDHRKVFSGDTIQGFCNARTRWAEKSALRDTRAGVPLYPTASSLSASIYHPSTLLNDHLASYVESRGGEAFFQKSGAETELKNEAEAFRKTSPGVSGTWETEEQTRKRMMDELTSSRDMILSKTGVTPVHFCWPWGEHTDPGMRLASKAGYQACYTIEPGCVSSDTNPYKIPRVSARGGKIKFLKKGFVFSRKAISKAYVALTR
jgi:peptidoglycan/xylan/chitin deacetylase (PgdA/CDA1 family)